MHTTERDTRNALLGKHLFTHDAYVSVFRNHPDILCVIDTNGYFLDCNDSVQRYFGYSREEWLNQNIVFAVPDRDKERLMGAFEQARAGTPQQLELATCHRDGSELYVDLSLVPAFVDGQVVGVYGFGKDISNRVALENELTRNQTRMSHAQDIAGFGIWEYDLASKRGAASEQMQRMFGFQPTDMIEGTGLDAYYNCVHPDDLGKVTQIHKVKELKDGALTEIRIIRPDGEMRTLLSHWRLTREGANNGKVYGVFQDITDKRVVEEELQERENLYYGLQTSLDQFSRDVHGVLKVKEIEERLVHEVRKVLGTQRVSVVMWLNNQGVTIRSGYPEVLAELHDKLTPPWDIPVCEINQTANGYFVKLGDCKDGGYFLCISDCPRTLTITANQVWLKTITRHASVLYDNFRQIKHLTDEIEALASEQSAPAWFLRLLFSLSENERKGLSQDLHDSALQEQIIWYRRLRELSADDAVPENFRSSLNDIAEGLLDVIYQIRITCNELRPPLLKEEGLVSSLNALFDFMQKRTNYRVEFDAENFSDTLSDEMLIGLYRIVQELLANATKHSEATTVHFALSSQMKEVSLRYHDNGIGMDISQIPNSFRSMGVYGMRERVRSMGGTITFDSPSEGGLSVSITVPTRLDAVVEGWTR